jgi:hypothetical protein
LNAHRWLDDPLPVREKSLEEKKAEELRLARQKSEREREESRKWFEEQERLRAAAVLPPERLRSLIRGS